MATQKYKLTFTETRYGMSGYTDMARNVEEIRKKGIKYIGTNPWIHLRVNRLDDGMLFASMKYDSHRELWKYYQYPQLSKEMKWGKELDVFVNKSGRIVERKGQREPVLVAKFSDSNGKSRKYMYI